MSIYGKIKEVKVVTLEDDLKSSKEKANCEYIRRKHLLAEKHGRYVVQVHIADPRFKKDHLSVVNIYLPKGIIDNNLIDKETEIGCSSDSCCLTIAGVEDYFDRVSNLDTQIHDIRSKSDFDLKPNT